MSANRCLDTDSGKINFKNYKSILNGLLNLFKIPMTKSNTLSSASILASKARPGLSPSLTAARIIKRQSQAGLPVGPLPSGQISPEEIMWTIAIEEIYKSLTSEAIISVASQPGTAIQGTGGNAGGPVQIAGTILGIASGNATMS